LLTLALLTAACATAAAAGDSYGPCPQIRFVGGERIVLNPMEIRLVCGDASTEGWGQIPFNQAENQPG